MLEFRKYMHIERFGTDEVQGIQFGECLVFPKIDGTNASIWMGEDGICFGSRNRHLTIDNDNQGFMEQMKADGRLEAFFSEHPNLRLYGEWLVPHSLKTYRDDAWRRFYVFDVYYGDAPLHYDEYKPMMDTYGIDYIPPIARGNNMTYEQLVGMLEKNDFLIADGAGCGEGIVIKNYGFENRHGRTTWAKIVTSEFKEKAHKEMGAPIVSGKKMVEQTIVDGWCTGALIEKEFAKLRNDGDGWNSKRIPELLGKVYHELITEDCWDFVKKLGNPVIDFRTLNQLVVMRVKQELPEVFGYSAPVAKAAD